jgi:hypothetical protein
VQEITEDIAVQHFSARRAGRAKVSHAALKIDDLRPAIAEPNPLASPFHLRSLFCDFFRMPYIVGIDRSDIEASRLSDRGVRGRFDPRIRLTPPIVAREALDNFSGIIG